MLNQCNELKDKIATLKDEIKKMSVREGFIR